MVVSWAHSVHPFNGFLGRLWSQRQPKRLGRGGKGCKLIGGQQHMRFPGIMASSVAMLPSAEVVMELAAFQASMPVVAMVTSPPRATSSRAGPVVPEVCLAMPKSKRRKMKGGGGNGDDDGGDGGNFYGGWNWDGDGEEDGEDDARKWGIMWNMLGVYSALQTLYFVLFGKEESPGSPILATITYSLCARIQEKYLRSPVSTNTAQ